MPDSYLWNRNGERDPEVEGLEELLGEFRHKGRPPRFEPSRRRYWLAAAAAVVLTVIGVVTTHHATWSVDSTGEVRVDSRSVNGSSGLTEQSLIETGSNTRAVVNMGLIGTATLEPSTRVRVERTSLRETRLSLEHGTISARISAPPRLFYVSTPLAEAIDLGCAYELSIDSARGTGRLRVTLGWVALDAGTGRVYVPAGSSVELLEQNRLAVPVRQHASEPFRAAVSDVVDTLPRVELQHLEVMRATATREDALSIWHLLRRADDDGRIALARLIAGLDENVLIDHDAIGRGDTEQVERIGRMLGVRESRWWAAWVRQAVGKLIGGSS